MGYRIIIRAVRSKNQCPVYKVGDTITYEDEELVGKICPTAFAALWPIIYAMRFGARFPWCDDKHSDLVYFQCPDIEDTIEFEIRRIPAKKRRKK